MCARASQSTVRPRARRIAAVAAGESAVCDIGPGDAAQLYPTYAALDEATGQWRLAVHGAVYQPGPEDIRGFWVVRMFERFLQPAVLQGEQANFEGRMRGFLRRDQRGRRIAVQIGSQRVGLRGKTLRNGHFAETISLADDLVQSQLEVDEHQQRWLCFALVPRDGQPPVTGRALLLAPSGTSVISDIDDTIKHTDVTRPQALLANTFLRPFEPIPSMAGVYQAWARQGAAFHYVSSSPDHLFDSLRELLEVSQFPRGTVHLTAVGSKNPSLYGVLHFLWDFYMLRRKAKLDAATALLRVLPRRRFVLVGDSGERDLEMYAELARSFPSQIARILLRVLPERPIDAARRRNVLGELSPALLHEFQHPDELPRELPEKL